jgi:hypothetical protein
VQEVADDLLIWQESKDQQVLIKLVKKIEQLFNILGNFEKSYSN